MKFERGRKKNQLIWGFILKDIASQSSVFNKNQKKRTLSGAYAFCSAKTSFAKHVSTQNTRRRGWVADSGSRGAHWSGLTIPPSPSSSSARTGRDSGDHRRRTAAPPGYPRAGMDLPYWGGPLGGRWVDGSGRSRRRRAPRRRGLRE